MAELYTYGVSRIRAKEAYLLKKQDLEQLLAAKSYNEAVLYLRDKGFDGGGDFSDYNELLNGETQKIWELMAELKIPKSSFDVFLCKKDFHNLKAAIKKTVTGAKVEKIYVGGGKILPQTIEEAVSKSDYSALPQNMAEAAKEAVSVLLQTGDGQKCDMIIDRYTLKAVKEAGENSGDAFLKKYAEITVAISDIKIAVRGCFAQKNADFMKDAMAECETVNIGTLSALASKSREDLEKYLEQTDYKEGVAALNVSFSQFEKWCDDLITEAIAAQKSNPFTIAPIAAYILAREIEIGNVRIILSGKANGLDEKIIRERLRELYV